MMGGITITGDGIFGGRDASGRFTPGLISRRAIPGLKKDALEAIATAWHRDYYEGHFTAEGARRYHYNRRFTKDITTGTPKRSKTGRPKTPDARPLVWSGRSLERGRNRRIVATPTLGRVIMPVNALNFTPKLNPTLRMRDELTRVTPLELHALQASATIALIIKLKSSRVKAVIHIAPRS